MSREFVDVNSTYYTKCEQAGKLLKIQYRSKTYDELAMDIAKDALIYLPYGYESEPQRSYPVFYLMHGGGGNSDEVFGGVDARTDLKNILDHMIEKGDIEPLIVVAPSFYYEGTTEALTSKKDARLLTQNFHHELINDLIPEIENTFRVKRGREHRAFGGYSMGSEATWNVFAKCLVHFKYFLPMSGDCWAIQVTGGMLCPQQTVDFLIESVKAAKCNPTDYRIFACVGDNGVAFKPMDSMISEMKLRGKYFYFHKDFAEGNIVYCVAHGGTHSYEYCYKYIYNALPHFFK
ncbi:MAG: hypothetical protein E7269_04265 [Lachnospiraceae bacterium]|nr:hypothetical protein [Lachnospiraceae bacterium]